MVNDGYRIYLESNNSVIRSFFYKKKWFFEVFLWVILSLNRRKVIISCQDIVLIAARARILMEATAQRRLLEMFMQGALISDVVTAFYYRFLTFTRLKSRNSLRSRWIFRNLLV